MLILERLLAGLKDACTAFPDKRTGEGVYSMANIRLSAFSLVFTQPESCLSYQRSLEEGRNQLPYVVRHATDNHIRSMLDPVAKDLELLRFGNTSCTVEKTAYKTRLR